MPYKEELNIPIAKNVTLAITEKCNLNCTYCYEKNKNLKTIPLETAKKLIDMVLSEDTAYDKCVIEFIGGEPLLEIKLIEEIIGYTEAQMIKLNHKWRKTLMYAFTTNGTVFTEEAKALLLRIKHYGSVGLSLDGIKYVHDLNRNNSYDKIMEDFKWWRETFPLSLTKSTVNRESLPYIFESVKHLISLGLKYIYINNVFEDIWEDEDTEIFREQLTLLADYLVETGLYQEVFVSYLTTRFFHDPNLAGQVNFCGCGTSMVSMDCSGTLYPCLRFQPIDNGKGLPIGHVDTGIEADKMLQFAFCNMNNLRDEYKDKCSVCKAKTICTWCTANNHNQTGSIFKRGKMPCDMILAQYDVNEYFFNRIREIEGGNNGN